MQNCRVPVLNVASRTRQRIALVASPDRCFRQRISQVLTDLRWQVREAGGGAQAWAEAESCTPEALIVDSWLPDLDTSEFLCDFRSSFPEADVLSTDGTSAQESFRGPYRQELLYALRRVQDTDTAAWNAGPGPSEGASEKFPQADVTAAPIASRAVPALVERANVQPRAAVVPSANRPSSAGATDRLPELVGNAPSMLEVSRRIRLVAPRTTPVLIEGATGTGKEVVAEALHRLSTRNRKRFVAINCAAIPESLLEAELFGHTRGAFTGAVQGRIGRIETADGGTLFLDEIGEMPIALQAKLLRFVESGELQRVGENETVKVDVRIIAATHQPLSQHTREGKFRSDLYYRLAVFLIRTPALCQHMEDLDLLVNHFLELMGRQQPIKQIDAGALAKLKVHSWPGNVRELQHVLERAAILAGDEPTITAEEIDFGMTVN